MSTPEPLDKWGPKPPREIDSERFWEALECLPPCQWQGMGTTRETFHVSERLSGNVVSWFVRYDKRFFQIDQDATMTRPQLFAMVADWIAAHP